MSLDTHRGVAMAEVTTREKEWFTGMTSVFLFSYFSLPPFLSLSLSLSSLSLSPSFSPFSFSLPAPRKKKTNNWSTWRALSFPIVTVPSGEHSNTGANATKERKGQGECGNPTLYPSFARK
jgi:hypothetical protein